MIVALFDGGQHVSIVALGAISVENKLNYPFQEREKTNRKIKWHSLNEGKNYHLPFLNVK